MDPRRDALTPTEAPPLPSLGRPGADAVAALLAEFAGHAEALGVRVGRAAIGAEAAAWIAAVAAELGVARAIVADELAEVAPELASALAGAEMAVERPGDPDAARDAPLGLSLARLAVAETGSLLLAEPTLADRAIGMLCLVHLIVCPTAALVPSLDEAAPALRDLALRPGGGLATLVTGPSRTADIERVLTVGVQGPGRVFVLFVDDLR